jgi:GNAT superfamily N-acetyltransferase
MPASITESFAELGRQAAQRLTTIDPLLPDSVDLPTDPQPISGDPSAACGTVFTACGDDGVVTAVGQCAHWAGEPGSMSLTWSSARQFLLSPVLSGPGAAAALDDLISQWRDHLAKVSEAEEDDTAAVIRWASRDVEGVRVLQRHGLMPQTVIAARVAAKGDRREGPARAAAPGIRVRRAGAADLDVATALGLALVRYEANFGSVHERPWTADALRTDVANQLAVPEPWVWIAERDGEPIGLLGAEPPAAAAWIAPRVRLDPVAYLGEMFVRPAERGSDAAALLIEQFNAAASAAGVAVTLLHYGQVNPLSGPFWSRQGYRPLWTTWAAMPARTLR